MAQTSGLNISDHDALTRLSADITAIEPSSGLKQKILRRLGFEGELLQLKNLPETNQYANHLSWLRAMRPLIPKQPVDNIFMRELRRDEKVVQTLVITKVDVPEEIHESYAESFFILEGRCACTIARKVFELFPRGLPGYPVARSA